MSETVVPEPDAVPTVATVRSIERAFEILRVLRESRAPLRLSEIARESGIHLATTQRIINALVRTGYATQDRSGYSLGITSLLNAHAFLVSNDLIQIALPIVQELAASTELTASLSVRAELMQILLVRVEGASPLRYQLPVGEPMPLYRGGARILAAALEPGDLDRLLAETPVITLANGATVSHEEFRETLRIIRRQGYVYGVSQRYLGAASAAAPVVGRDGSVVASLQISGLAEDFDKARMEWYISELKRACTSLESRLP